MASATHPAGRSPARAALRTAARASEEPVLRAFLAVVRHQRRRGGLTPAVEATLAEALSLADLSSTDRKSRHATLRRAIRRASRVLEAGDGPLGAAGERHAARLLDRLVVTKNRRARTDSPAVRAVIRTFHRLFYDDFGTWHATTWQGIRTLKCPLDLWLYQEIVHRIRPGLIVETGTAYGGSASYLAWLCDIVGAGRIVSVDIAPYTEDLPEHPRVTYLRGSSTDPAIVERVRSMVPPGEPVLVILDSDHSEAHVRDELMAYADLVTPGSYLIVEDTNVNGHPAHPGHGPGPMEALNWFLPQRPDYRVDKSMHRYHMTLNPRGYLRRLPEG